MTVVRSKSHGVQMSGDHMFWGTKLEGPPDSKVRNAAQPSVAAIETLNPRGVAPQHSEPGLPVSIFVFAPKS